MKASRRDIAVAAMVLTVAVLMTAVYLNSQRAESDASFAGVTLWGLEQRLSAGASEATVGAAFSFDLLVPLNVDVYLSSDSARRNAATTPIRETWLAYRTLHFIEDQRSRGTTEPAFVQVPTALEAITVYPELVQFVGDNGSGPRFVDVPGLEKVLRTAALRKSDEAMQLNLAQHPGYQPNLAPLP